MYKNKHYTQPRSLKKPILIVVGIVLLLTAIVTVLELTNVTTFFHTKDTLQTPHTANQNTKGEAPNPANPANNTSKDTNGNSGDGTWPSDNKTPNGDSGDGTKPTTPTGNFVGNHHPYLTSKKDLNIMQSSCVTTSGATCQITFTKDGVTKELSAKKTDVGGGAYWDWKLQDLGLTVGSWKVQAKAQLGTQTVTADDSLSLEVSE